MQYAKCKCGKAEMWHSGMAIHDCMGCEDCKTTYAGGPEGHRPLQPHKWTLRFSGSTGKPDMKLCAMCYHTERLEPGDAEKLPTMEQWHQSDEYKAIQEASRKAYEELRKSWERKDEPR